MLFRSGCFDGNHITGVYVLPSYQKQGCGSHIMNCLEREIARMYDTAVLDASLPAACYPTHTPEAGNSDSGKRGGSRHV